VRETVTDTDADFRYLTKRSAASAAVLTVLATAIVTTLALTEKFGTEGDGVLLLVLGCLLLMTVVALARVSAEVGRDGVTMSSLVQPRLIPWVEVKDFRCVPGEKGGIYVDLASAQTIRLPTNRPSRSRDEHWARVAEQLEGLRGRYQTP
jgi:hypothetical protein